MNTEYNFSTDTPCSMKTSDNVQKGNSELKAISGSNTTLENDLNPSTQISVLCFISTDFKAFTEDMKLLAQSLETHLST